MALNTFDAYAGLRIAGTVELLTGTGAPGGTSATDNAVQGSTYQDQNGSHYVKEDSGAGADKWRKVATEEFVNNTVTGGVSWREPVVAHDDSTTTIASAPTTVDGVTINSGDRVLFSAISGGDGPNIYIYNGTTYDEDSNNETSGDTTYVQEGTVYAGNRFTYNGTAWVRSNTSDLEEMGFIRSFVGKTAEGAESPTYSSTNQITQAGSLETAIGELDASVGPDVTTDNYITDTNSANENIQSLSNGLTTLANQQSQTTVDPVNIGVLTDIDVVTARQAKWLLYVKQAVTDIVEAYEIVAAHDGTNVDSSAYAVLRPNGAISVAELTIDVVLENGTDMKLQITALVNPVAATAKRVSILS